MVRIIHFPMQDFQTIAHLIPNFEERVDDPPQASEAQNAIGAIFNDFLGQSARFIQPVLFRSGRLIVYAEAAVWGQHILHRSARLLERCKDDGLYVTDISVKISPGSVTVQNQEHTRTVNYDPVTASRHLKEVAAQTHEPRLKRSLLRLSDRILKNHSGEI